ncbi:hypothetical protein [Clostridium tertium]|uniref:hypothetical protein n=1 Tax=Clostridium tertium TaxID=1559 RepID=UPI0012E7A7F7
MIWNSTEEETFDSDIKLLLEEMKNINLKVNYNKKNYKNIYYYSFALLCKLVFY